MEWHVHCRLGRPAASEKSCENVTILSEVGLEEAASIGGRPEIR